MNIFDLCPTPPDWPVDWRTLDERFALVRDLRGCPQNPRFHAEGDVWVHTRMVCEAMAQLEAWRALPEEERQDLFAAALFHDAAKPECTRVREDGRITSRGHARRGALLARRELWRAGVDPERRERICRLVRHHMAPLYLRDSDQPRRQILTLSHILRCDRLALLGLADAEGRISEDGEDLEARHRYFESACHDEDCFDRPYAFPSDHARFRFLRQLSEAPDQPVPEPEVEVVMLSGLPGSGRRAWLEAHAGTRPVIDMDEQRRRLDIDLRDNQGPVIAAGRELARRYLAAGQSFIWRDMNLSRQLRDHLIDLFAEFDARVSLVHLEKGAEAVREHLRGAGLEGEMDYLLDRWETPDPSEAHDLRLIAG